jgi:oxygen-independent coproporphyrinogen-3 oxidase
MQLFGAFVGDPVIDITVIQKFDKPGPRYTSYPTAPEWSPNIQGETYAGHLRTFGQTAGDLSLYVHIPFCESMCYFCACTTNIRSAEGKGVDEYLDHVEQEVCMVARAIGSRKILRQMHWGGGTPSFMTEPQIRRLHAVIAAVFDIDRTGDISIEVDPRRVTRSKVELLRSLGFNRISIGVQDFDATVQAHVNRIESYAMVEEFNRWCRDAGFTSVNFDLIYGMPHQTVASFSRTVSLVTGLRPDRIALYSFAFVPWVRKHQQKLDKSAMPSAADKLKIFLNARDAFLSQGYEAIAMDHFALASDSLASAFRAGELYRNFMGYTTRPAQEYIGIGASAIGFLGQGYFHNWKTLPAYYKGVRAGQFPVERGIILSDDDSRRQWVINQIMCRFVLDRRLFRAKFGDDFNDYFGIERPHIDQCLRDDLLVDDGDTLRATALGKLFVRVICMGFDRYLRDTAEQKQFSRTI